jgi:AraC-like DNA-binding protein
MPPVTSEHASPLGRWSYTEWSPRSLAGVIHRIWDFDGLTTFRYERAFPNGLAELIVHLGDRFREDRGARGRFELCPAACLTGIQTRPFVVESPGRRCQVLGIRLTPIGVFLLLGASVHSLTDETVALADVVGPLARRLEDRLADAPDSITRVRRAAAWVAERVGQARPPSPAVAWMAAAIERSHGTVRISHLQAQVGYSRATLAHRFRDQVGLTPKIYGRVVRFHRALTLLNRAGASLGRVAAEAGYYDQPHLNAEFRELGGMAPSEFLGAIRYENSVNLAET